MVSPRGAKFTALVLAFLCLSLCLPAGAQSLLITEFMAVNDGPLRDENGDTSDWIEIHNAGDVTTNLEGCYLTDTVANLVKWRFPWMELPAGGFVVVFASGKDRLSTRPLHTNFKLEAGGEYLALVQPDGLTVANHYSPTYPLQQSIHSYGLPMNDGPLTNQVPGFLQPTPGFTNGPLANLGPRIGDLTYQPLRPEATNDIIVTARVVARGSAVRMVTLNYRVMFGPTNAVPMLDDGLHGDVSAGDGVYGGSIPQGTTGPGEMVRWSVVATDQFDNASQQPPMPGPSGGPEHFGTMITTNLTSALPIFHLFVAPNYLHAVDTESGGRVSVFHDGEFYDNVYMEIRGNLSASQNKKSHRLEFNGAQTFRHSPIYPRVRKTSLLAEYEDASYLRQNLSFWLLNRMGVPAPFHYPVRTHLNGSYYALAFHSDVIDEEQMARMGYDPRGALYKAAGNILPSRSSTGVFQKLTEPRNDDSDYQVLSRAINETNTPPGQPTNLSLRRAAAFDRLDIPQVVNYLAGARWCAEADDVWSNLSLYRDTYGDGLWRIIPFDMNVSWGQRYGGITPLDATNDTCKSHPLYGGSTIIACDGSTYNRIYDVVIAVPETRQMLLRRMRTVLDRWVNEPGVRSEWRLLETHIQSMTNLIWDEAFLDRAKWGYSTWTASNKPLTNAVDELFNQFINPRRHHWSVVHSVTNTAKPIGITPTSNAGIPLPQPTEARVLVTHADLQRPSANPDERYIALTNPLPYAVDISGWRMEGDAQFTFKEGTVMPAGSLLYVAREIAAFRARQVPPRGGMGLFVVGPFVGQFSALGAGVSLRNRDGWLVHTNHWIGDPSPVQSYLRVAEIHYHPAAVVGIDAITPDHLEFIELVNTGSLTLDLTQVRLSAGITFAFTNALIRQLEAGQRIVLVKDIPAFTSRYGTGVPVAGQYSGSLSDSSERLVLEEYREVILDFKYDASWYPITDGPGFSLVVEDPAAAPDAWRSPAQWRPSGIEHGTPGGPDPGPMPQTSAGVVISELLSNPEQPWEDSVELFNAGLVTVDISGWFLTDEPDHPRKFQFPPGTVLASGDYLALDEHSFNPSGPFQARGGFSFSALGERVQLLSAETNGRLTGYAHGFAFGPAEANVPFGRHVISTGVERFVAQKQLSLAESNAGPRIGPLVVTEIYFHPPEILVGDSIVNNTTDEFIELSNLGVTPLALHPTNVGGAWRLRGAIEFDFPTNSIIPPGGLVVVCSLGSSDETARDAFRRRHQLPEATPLLGPWTGTLNNQGARLSLSRPALVDGVVADVELEQITFNPDARAAGTGASLQRLDANRFGDDPAHWVSVGRTPGGPYQPGGIPPTILSQPANVTVFAGSRVELTAFATGTPPLFYQWRLNGVTLPGAISPELVIPGANLGHAGAYSCAVVNAAGVTESQSASLTVRIAPSFLSPPTNVVVRIPPDPAAAPSTNAVFQVSAATLDPPLTYQWRFNGKAIPGATNSSLQVSNVTLADEGDYICVVTDAIGSAASQPARLSPLISPRITLLPLDQRVVTGATVTVSATVSGNPVPFTFEWRRGSTPIVSHEIAGRQDFWTFIAPTNLATNSYRVVVKNQANSSPGVPSPIFTVTTLADTDADGLPDEFEAAHGLNATDVTDAALDSDGDGMTNGAEYIAGTEPQDPLSYLRIEPPLFSLPEVSTGPAIEFLACSNRTYALEARDALVPGPWRSVAEVVATPTNRLVTIVDPQPAGTNGQRVYRLVTPRRP